MNDKFSYSLSHLMTLCNKTMILDLPGESTNTLHLIQCLFKVTFFLPWYGLGFFGLETLVLSRGNLMFMHAIAHDST